MHSRASAHLRHPPAQADQEEAPVVKKFRRLPFNQMANKLKTPADDKKDGGNRPEPIDEQCGDEQRQRKNDQRNADRVTEPVDRILMASTVLMYPFVPRFAAEHDDVLPVTRGLRAMSILSFKRIGTA